TRGTRRAAGPRIGAGRTRGTPPRGYRYSPPATPPRRTRTPPMTPSWKAWLSEDRFCRMAILHRADLRPTKLELLAGRLPGPSSYPGPSTPGLSGVASYRFDDPAGEVGVETMLVRSGDGPILQAPLTYRSAPLDGAEAWLLGTCEHSVLGRRWVY